MEHAELLKLKQMNMELQDLVRQKTQAEAKHRLALQNAEEKYSMEVAELERSNQSQLVSTFMNDQHDFAAQLGQMGIVMSDNKWRQYIKRQAEISAPLADVGLEPNNTQYGCAVGAICDGSRQRCIISVPSGKGKSRIIAAIIAMRAQSNLFKQPHFTIVYSCELLKEMDREKYERLAILY